MIRWIDDAAQGSRDEPSVLVARGASPERRRALLEALVASTLGLDPAHIAVEHRPGRRPLVIRPNDSGLWLSSASRGEIAAVAVASAPLGIDVETVDADAEIPWRALHPTEAAMLGGFDREARAAAFARLWSLKEAYLKALRVGLSREPSTFAVRFASPETAVVNDPFQAADVADARTTWRQAGATCAALSAILLAPRSP